jgi:Cu-Zn family superoxide dismutase
MKYTLCLTVIALATALPAAAANVTVAMHRLTQQGTGEDLGKIVISGSDAGAVFTLDLHGLPPGQHGFHVHENSGCGPTNMNDVRIPGGAAGGHLDPDHTNKHEGPAGEGHRGDLPVLTVEANGTATQKLTAPRIKDIKSLRNHALIIHAGGDTYSDTPNALGGGGGRLACGVIE